MDKYTQLKGLPQMKFNHLLTILTFVISSTAYSMDGALKYYRTGVIPRAYGNCDTLKAQAAESFAKATNLRVVSSQCDQNSRGANVQLTYVSDHNQEIEITTTRAHSDYDDVAGRGYTKTLADCEARKESVVEIFRTSTGLQPFFVHCMEDPAANESTHPWHVGIDAVGSGAMTYQYIDRSLSDGLSSDPQEFLNHVRDYLRARPDTNIVDVVYRFDALDFARIGIASFAKKRIDANKIDGLSNRRPEDCAIEADAVGAAATLGGIRVMTFGCANHRGDVSSTVIITEGRVKLFFNTTGIEYETMDACRGARSSIFADMRGALGDTVVGVTCSDGARKPTAFVIQIEEKNP